MQVDLEAVVPPRALETELEDKIMEWFDEAVWKPILDLMDIERTNALDDWELFPAELGSLGVQRSDMPQVEASHRGALIAFLAARGIAHKAGEMPANELQPTQAMFSPAKVERARKNDGDRSVLVSLDLYVVDGHHQWYAALQDDPAGPLPIIIFDASVEKLLVEMGEFPSVVRDNATVSPEIDAALRSGRLIYANGAFSGDFNAKISRALRQLGAKFDERGKVYRLALDQMPYALRGAVAAARERSLDLHEGIKRTLDLVGQNVADTPVLGLGIDGVIGKILKDLNQQFVSAVGDAKKGMTALEAVTVPADFSASMTRQVREHLTDTLELPIKNFTEEQTRKLRLMVEENWQKGGRFDRIQEILRNQYGVTQRKAKFLAQQETTMLASEFIQARAQDVGSTEYRWDTRRDAKVRLDHKKLEGKTFSWDDPPLADSERGIHANPGMVWGCLPGDARVEIAHRVKKAFRRWYAGELATFVTEDGKSFKATPNHPVLTSQGWKAIGELDQADYVIQLPAEHVLPLGRELDRHDRVAVLSEIFDALREVSIRRVARGSRDDFDGDGADGKIEIVGPARFLGLNRQAVAAQRFLQDGLTFAAALATAVRALGMQFLPPLPGLLGDGSMGGLRQSFAGVGAQPLHADQVGLRAGPDRNALLDQNTPDHVAAKARPQADGELALPAGVGRDERRGIGRQLVPGSVDLWDRHTSLAELTRQAVRTEADDLLHFLQGHALGQKALRVVEVRREKFAGHVYNLETAMGWYGINGLIFHNCRCVARPILNLQARRVA